MARNIMIFAVATCMALTTPLPAATPQSSATPDRDKVDALSAPAGWTTAAPRDELRPDFDYAPSDSDDGAGVFIIRHDAREGLSGWWTKTFAVEGGAYYRFAALRKVEQVEVPRRSVVARIVWKDATGKSVKMSEPSVNSYLRGSTGNAEPEHPLDRGTNADGWTEVSDVFQVPRDATQAIVELHLQWAPGGSVQWKDVGWTSTDKPAPRLARLASVHYRPSGKSPAENCREFAPLIAEAAKQHADLVVLGETVTYAWTGKTYDACAESIPGPSTDYFGELARQHDLYIVAGLVERDGHLLYNVAVLIDPHGHVAGKYRKVCITGNEIANGCQPGNEYPVFDTRFGKLGMMVCYDGFFPEVARQLTNRGAEVIAWPVWGCNPDLALARACENHVYLVSSTYTDIAQNWMRTAVFGRTGEALSMAEDFGSVIVSEVDLNQRSLWNSLGDFQAKIPRHRPITDGE